MYQKLRVVGMAGIGAKALIDVALELLAECGMISGVSRGDGLAGGWRRTRLSHLSRRDHYSFLINAAPITFLPFSASKPNCNT
jgi:hypothetical protein